MILPTVTTMTVDALKLYLDIIVKRRWRLVLRVGKRFIKLSCGRCAGILTAVVFGMARAFGEALAIKW